MTLHNAIVDILTDYNKEMTTQEIAEELNKRKTYTKRDGSLISSYQIHGRTKNYPKIFYRSVSLVGLKVWKNSNNGPSFYSSNEVNYSIAEFLIPDDVTNISSLKKMLFNEMGVMGEFLKSGLPNLDKLKFCGIYAISIPEKYDFDFLSLEESNKRGNVNNPWKIDRLRDKWVDNVDIIYFGLAGRDSPRSLKDRLIDLINHGSGKTTEGGPHEGGEIIWQLKDYENLSLWVLPTFNPPVPRNIEKMILNKFHENTGKLPFANRQF